MPGVWHVSLPPKAPVSLLGLMICFPAIFRIGVSSCINSHVLQYALVTPSGRMVDPVLQSTLEMRIRFCRAAKPHLLTDVVSPFQASLALAAGNTNF